MKKHISVLGIGALYHFPCTVYILFFLNLHQVLVLLGSSILWVNDRVNLPWMGCDLSCGSVCLYPVLSCSVYRRVIWLWGWKLSGQWYCCHIFCMDTTMMTPLSPPPPYPYSSSSSSSSYQNLTRTNDKSDDYPPCSLAWALRFNPLSQIYIQGFSTFLKP